MIEIIKLGTKKTCTCNECGCYFSYEDEDVETRYTSSNVFGVVANLPTNVIKCPQCDTEIILSQIK